MLLIEKALQNLHIDLNEESNRYYNSEGKAVPRVTDVISTCSDSQGLILWANSLGLRNKRYLDELEKAANYGTTVHSHIEDFLRNKTIYSNDISFRAFLRWYENLTKDHSVKVLYLEERMANDWYGGTLDCVLEIDGRVFIIDFKTSNSIREKYFLQLAAYRALLYTTLNVNADGVIVLQLSKRTNDFVEYVLDFSINEHYVFIEECYRAFLALLYAYYNSNYIAERFKALFPNAYSRLY